MSFFSNLLPLAGTAAGSFFGGPVGGAVGGALGGALGGKGGALGGSQRNPASAAMPYLDQIAGVGRQNYQPFIDQGQRQGQALEGQYGNLMQDPTSFLNALMRGYQPSEGYNFQKDQLTKHLGNTAAAGGYRGSENDQLQQGQLIQQLLSGDMQSFLNNVLGLYGQGLQGAQQQQNLGYGAANGLSDYLGNSLGNQADFAYQGQAAQNKSQANKKNSLLNFIGQGAGTYFGNSGPGEAFGKGGKFEGFPSWG